MLKLFPSVRQSAPQSGPTFWALETPLGLKAKVGGHIGKLNTF